MTNGTYVGPRPVAAVPDDIASSIEHAVGLWPEVRAFVAGLPAVDRVHLVGAGGSLLGLQAAQFVLDREAGTPALSVNSDEYTHRASPTVAPGALAVVLSGTGNTPETVRAAEFARDRGAAVAAVTLQADGPLASTVETSGEPERVRAFVARTGQGTQVLLQLLALAVLDRDGVDVSAHLDALRALPSAIVHAVEEFEPRAAAIAEDMQDVPVTYLLASGPLVGPGATFTTCYLQEMQWMHAATVNADEFFQGPFEVVDRDTKTIVFVGEDSTRPMIERVQRFLDGHGGPRHEVDSRSLTLPGIAADQRAYVAPLVYATLVARLAAHYAAVRGYTLEGRRYMWQFDY